jgi:hypothetical protein
MANNLKTPADFAKFTNIDELIVRTSESAEQPQPMIDSTSLDQPVSKRSTTDPLEINFAQVDMISALSKKSVKKPVRWFAWIFLAGPLLVLWPFLVFSILRGASEDVHTFEDLLIRLFALAAASAVCGFWPYILLRRN